MGKSRTATAKKIGALALILIALIGSVEGQVGGYAAIKTAAVKEI